MSETTLVNVHVKNLRVLGYQSLKDWLEAGNGNHIYIGRTMPWVEGADSSKWCNPFSVQKYGREKCLLMFREYLMKKSQLLQDLEELRGRVLGCWCQEDQDCHGKILIELLKFLI